MVKAHYQQTSAPRLGPQLLMTEQMFVFNNSYQKKKNLINKKGKIKSTYKALKLAVEKYNSGRSWAVNQVAL